MGILVGFDDHATNIAEDVISMAEGNVVRHKPEEYPAGEPCGGSD